MWDFFLQKTFIILCTMKVLIACEESQTVCKEWENSVIVSNKLKISQGNISSNALGYRKSAGGYTWKFKN